MKTDWGGYFQTSSTDFPLLGKNSPQTSQLRNNIDLLVQSFFSFLIYVLTQEA